MLSRAAYGVIFGVTVAVGRLLSGWSFISLDVDVASEWRGQCPGPRPLLLHLCPGGDTLIGGDGSHPTRVRGRPELTQLLRTARASGAARVFVEASDGVAHDRIVALVDAARGEEFDAVTLWLGPSFAAAWQLPFTPAPASGSTSAGAAPTTPSSPDTSRKRPSPATASQTRSSSPWGC